MSTLEQDIQARGLNAPRVTPADIDAAVARAHYLNAWDAAAAVDGVDLELDAPLKLLTLCVLVLKNGFTVVGKSACASPENFNAEIGRKVALDDAKRQVWPLLGYALRERLHSTQER